MARLSPFITIRFLILVLAIGFALGLGTVYGFHKGPVTYDFNSLSGSNLAHYTTVNGQDNWTSNGFIFGTPIPSWHVGVTNSLGFDGSQSLQFVRVGAGFGADASRLNDKSFGFKTMNKISYFQADFGVSFWGGQFALAYDANGDGVIRKTGPSEIGPTLTIGSNSPLVGVQLRDAAGTITKVPLSAVSGVGGDWIRLRLQMDLNANGGQGSGTVYYQNLSDGDTALQIVPGLVNINLALDKDATDGSNPKLWNAMWLHFEGAVNQLDNIEIDNDNKKVEKDKGKGKP